MVGEEDAPDNNFYFGRGGLANKLRSGSTANAMLAKFAAVYQALDNKDKKSFVLKNVYRPTLSCGGKFVGVAEESRSPVHEKDAVKKLMQALRDINKREETVTEGVDGGDIHLDLPESQNNDIMLTDTDLVSCVPTVEEKPVVFKKTLAKKTKFATKEKRKKLTKPQSKKMVVATKAIVSGGKKKSDIVCCASTRISREQGIPEPSLSMGKRGRARRKCVKPPIIDTLIRYRMNEEPHHLDAVDEESSPELLAFCTTLSAADDATVVDDPIIAHAAPAARLNSGDLAVDFDPDLAFAADTANTTGTHSQHTTIPPSPIPQELCFFDAGNNDIHLSDGDDDTFEMMDVEPPKLENSFPAMIVADDIAPRGPHSEDLHEKVRRLENLVAILMEQNAMVFSSNKPSVLGACDA